MQFPYNKKRKVSAYRKTNIVSCILLIVAVIIVSLLVYFKSQGVDFKNISIKDFVDISMIFTGSQDDNKLYKSSEIKYNNKEHVAFTAFNDFLVTCTRDNIRFLDKNGNEQLTIPISMNSPIFVANDTWLLAADIGGKEISLFHKSERQWEVTIEGNIINAYVGNNGDVAVVHESKGYKSALSVYDSKGMKKFSTQFAERFLMSVVISQNGKYILASFIDASGININSIMENIDTSGNGTGKKITKENDIYIGTWFMQDDSYIAVSANEVECFSKESNEKWSVQFTQGILSSALCSGSNTAIASKMYSNGIISSNKSEITIIDNKGKAEKVYQVDGEIRNLEAYGDIIAVNTGSTVYFINVKGKLLGRYDSDIEINVVYFFSKQEVVIISKNTAVVVKM